MAIQQMSVSRGRQHIRFTGDRVAFLIVDFNAIKFLPTGSISRKVHRHRIHAAVLQADAGQEAHP